MKLFLYPNTMSDERRAASVRCADKLRGRFELYAAARDADLLNCEAGECRDCDAVVAFGGDGTMLRAAQVALEGKKPLLGVNTGRLGYLCALTEDDLNTFDEAALSRLTKSPRAVIAFLWQGKVRYALNELIVAKGDYGATIDVTAKLDDAPLDKWQGDGVLVVTPTGSSAYNQSAGGPRLLNGCGCFVLTPLCPTHLNRSPIVFSDQSRLTLCARPRFSPQEVRVYADGVYVGALAGELPIWRREDNLMLMTKG